MRVLITGITGFAGGFLAEALAGQKGVELIGAARRAAWPAELTQLRDRAELRSCDFSEASAVDALLAQVQPAQIYHLAGYPHVGRSFREPDAAWTGNLTATRNLFASIMRWGGKPRILQVSSGMIYGAPDTPAQKFTELSPLRPLSPYAASKAAADLAGYQVVHAPGLEVIRVRPFNHIGPRQSPEFALPHFAQQLAAIEKGQQPPVIETGDLRPERDLTDVRDMAAAYILLMEKGKPGEVYNAGTGELHSMQELLDRFLALARVRVEVKQRADLLRARETPATRADASKLRALGWAPRFTLEQTLTDILGYWREVADLPSTTRGAV